MTFFQSFLVFVGQFVMLFAGDVEAGAFLAEEFEHELFEFYGFWQR